MKHYAQDNIDIGEDMDTLEELITVMGAKKYATRLQFNNAGYVIAGDSLKELKVEGKKVLQAVMV